MHALEELIAKLPAWANTTSILDVSHNYHVLMAFDRTNIKYVIVGAFKSEAEALEAARVIDIHLRLISTNHADKLPAR